MLDIQRIRRYPRQVQENFDRRGADISVEGILWLDEEKLRLQTDLQERTHEKNLLSKEVAARKKQGADAEDLLLSIRDIDEKIRDLEGVFHSRAERLQDILFRLPNLLDDDVPETAEILYHFKEKPVFGFQPKSHIELCRRHGKGGGA